MYIAVDDVLCAKDVMCVRVKCSVVGTSIVDGKSEGARQEQCRNAMTSINIIR